MPKRTPKWQPAAKVRESAKAKFYWFDPGVARAAARRLDDPLDDLSRGAAFETLVFHELRARLRALAQDRTIAYYRTKAGDEIDFVLELERKTLQRPAKVILIEAKASRRWRREWERPMRSLAESGAVRVVRSIGVYLGSERLSMGGVEVLPWSDFATELASGALV